MQNTFYNGLTGRQLLKKKFNLCDDFDENNLTKSKQFFFSNIISYFQDINQYSGDNRNAATRNGLGIPKACVIMTNSSLGDEMDRVKQVLDWYTVTNGGKIGCYDNSYSKYLKKYTDTSYTDIDDVVGSEDFFQPAGCGQTLTATDKKQFLINKLGHGQVPSDMRDDYQFCNYWIEAPEGKRIEVKINAISHGYDHEGCVLGGVEINPVRTKRELATGEFCSTKDKNTVLVSATNRMPVIMFNRSGEQQIILEYKIVS
ncbi:hypothetical protein OSTOST_22170 [Ostertagia ostertagi]